MNDNTWYYLEDGQQKGPVSEITLRQLLAQNVISVHTLLWRKGMEAWQPAWAAFADSQALYAMNKRSRKGSRKLPVWLCILLAHVFASYIAWLAPPIIDYFQGDPITSGSFGSFGFFILAPIHTPLLILFMLFLFICALPEHHGNQPLLLWICYGASLALCYFLLNWYAKRKRWSQQKRAKKMNEADDNNQPSRQKASYLAIWSLVLSICGACCLLALWYVDWLVTKDPDAYVLVLELPYCVVALLLGIAALIQRTQSYRRLWWLAIVGISICAVSMISCAIYVVVCGFWRLPR